MVLKFTGSAFFRQRIVLATLASKTIVIRDIRSNEERPGISGAYPASLIIVKCIKKKCTLLSHVSVLTSKAEYEASLLRLVEKVTNGSRIEIDVTGAHYTSCH